MITPQPQRERALSFCFTKSLSAKLILSSLWLLFSLEYASAQLTQVIKVNFSDGPTVSGGPTAPPAGHLRDHGLAYGVRTATEQGTSGQAGFPTYTFGWVAPGTSTGVNLSALGRNRNNTNGLGMTNIALATFMHMDHPTQTNPRGNWEILLPAGTYKVTVSVGDGLSTGTDPERHRINAEGVNLIDLFIPSGGNGSATRFSSGSGIVNVSDGKLTIDYAGTATNGQTAINTKINYVIIEPQRPSEPVFSTFPVQVNFQNPNTIPPNDWLADYGQAYGARNSAYQGSGFTYGWVQLANPTTPLNLAAGGDQPGNGRTRNFAASGSAIIDATFMHMQYTGTNGTAASGSWKIDVPNGFYTVTVKTGESTTEGTANTLHRLEVEGIADVVNYNPFNPVSGTNSPTGTVNINVTDGNILIKPTGFNTKIISAIIAEAAPPSNLPPIVSNPTQTIKLFDNQSIGSNIAQVNANDPDVGQTLSYAITSGNTNNTFAINNSGQITLNANLNYTATPNYTLGITVSDDGSPQGTANATVTVNVSEFITNSSFPYQVNFQDAATLPPSGWVKDYGQSYGNRTDNQQGSGFTYGWKRRDNGNPLDLTLNGRNRSRSGISLLQNTLMHMQGDDLTGFTGTSVEGIWEIDIPNGMYQVTVSVGDQPGANNVYDSQHTIIVEGVNAINLFQATAANEFQSATVVVTVNDGKLTLDAGGTGGNNTKINSIIIAQYSNQAPQFANTTYNFSVDENAANGTIVGTVSATDAENSPLTYSITAGNTGNVFAINNNGQITVANPLNFEADNAYQLTVSATDNGTPNLSGTTTVNISLNNINENPIVNTATFSIPENASVSSVVGTVSASDPDNNDLSFEITDGNTNNAFAIDNSGQITVGNALNYETQSAYNLTVTVTDNGNPNLSSTAAITINVENINEAPSINAATFNVPEHSPNGTVVGTVTASDPDNGNTLTYSITNGNVGGVFSIDNAGQITVANDIEYDTHSSYNLEVTVEDNGSPALSSSATITVNIQEVIVPNQTPTVNSASININEDLANGVVVTTVSANDPDNHNLTYAITGGNTNNAFSINSTTGEITLANALNFETNNVYNLTITVTDDGVPNLSANGTITINIQDVNESPIVNSATFSIIENAANGTSVGTVNAADPDAGQTLSYSIISGNTGNVFSIDTNTGEITLVGSLNYLNTPSYTLNIQATDNGNPALSSSANITINVTDFNESPILNAASFNISEDASIGSVVGTVSASDPDNNTLTYSILSGNTNDDFAINTNTGQITVAKALNFNDLQSYSLNVQVSDNGNPSLSANATITININDVNYPPTLNVSNFNVQETAPIGTLVGTVTGSDSDAGQTLTYAITGGNTNNAFSINNSGQITVASALSFSSQAVYSLTIQVSDNGSPSQSVSNNLTINVLDEITPNDFPYQVNFQDPNTIPPSGWIRDFGQAYGARTDNYQGAGFTYGWVTTNGTTPLNLSVGGTAGNGRNRNTAATGSAIIDATLMHMQYNNVPNGTNGTAQEGFWKIDLPNGIYDVTVRVGDLSPETNAGTHHVINAEGVNVVDYTPTLNAVGFSSGTKIVRVNDGNLLITATGGFNTKIISAIIAQHVNQAPTVANTITNQNAIAGQAFSFLVPNNTFSDIEEDALTLTATLSDNSPLPSWLNFNGSQFSGTPSSGDVAVLNIKVTASDGQLSVNTTFTLTVIVSSNNAPVVVNPIANQTGTIGVAFTLPIPSNTFNDPNNDPLTLTATLANGSALPNWLSFNGLQFSGTPLANNAGTLTIKLTASDGELSVSDEFELAISGCSPISTLNCDQIKVNLSNPLVLNFTGNEGGLANTGFTMVDAPSARIPEDGSVSNSTVPGFEPSRLSFSNGKLIINANKGIAYVNPATSTETNSQINTLGVGFDANDNNFDIETTIINPYTDGSLNSEQAGLWFGLNEDNFVKLVAMNVPGTVELRREVNAVSGTAATDVAAVANVSGLHTSTVKLRLNVNISTLIVTGFYSLNGGAEVQVGTLQIPAGFLNGATVNGEGISFAGIFATKRREVAATTVNYTFEDFKLTPIITPNQSPVIANQSFNILETASIGAVIGNVVASDPNVGQTLTYAITNGNTNEDLAINSTTGQLTVAKALSNANQSVYNLTVQVTDNGNPALSASATITINVQINTPNTVFNVKVNFQDNTVAPPSGYLKDIGQPYAQRTEADQGNSQYTYGWINPSNGQPADLSGVARTRLNTGLDLKTSTFIHMDHPTQTNPRGNWEIAVPNGTYQVTVSVGDPSIGADPETHRVNAENVNIINNFVPNNTANSLGRFATGTANNVVVTDGKLTLSYSGGGVNTKLNYVEITSINIPPALQFAATPNTITLQAGQTGTIGNALATTNNTDPQTAVLNAVDNATSNNPNWLKINGLPINNFNFTTGAEITFEFDATGLSAGAYTATVTASANGYQNGSIVLTMNVSNPVQLANFKVNFSDQATTAPSGWLQDYGQAFGDRGNGQNYGWMNVSRSATLNLVGNGRNRDVAATGENIIGVTLMHMQYNNVPNGTNGIAQEGVWEAQVPNGSYSVTVRVGDTQNEGVTGTKHVVNVEGINVINFTAVLNSPNESQGTVNVTVTDGRITLDANGGLNTKIKSVIIQPAQSGQNPAILAVNPVNGAVNVAVNASITANQLYLPNPDQNGIYGVDNTTLNNNSVRLFKVNGNVQIPSVVNGTGGGDAITLTPSVPLENSTAYRFEITADVKDKAGFSFIPFSSTFTTTSGSTGGGSIDLNSVSFTKVGTVASGAQYTSLTIGPDGKLYGLTLGGDIHRWTISSVDGTLSNRETLNAWKTPYGDRSAVGLVFSPSSTANNLIAFVSHCSSGLSSAPDWDGKISRLTGANLETERLIVTNLPRSLRDHLTNSIAFKPGEPNVLYFNQGSNSAGGAPDGAWGNREESLLSGATLRLDLDKLPENNWPLDAKTSRVVSAINSASVNSATTTDGLYNPYYINAPLTVFASGIRNAYDLVWHSNGQLYVPANGTAGGSNTPASINGMRRPDGTFYDHNNPNYPVIPATTNNETQRDWLFRVNPNEPYGYFGHPNPYRGEFVLNRGKTDVAKYPNGTQADIRYRGAAFDFEFNKSPNGVIEYQSNAENGKLKGAILVVRYSGGDDIIALVPNGNGGDIGTSKVGIPGFTGFSDPLDLIEDVNTGNIYVSEFGASRITLLRPNNQASATPVITLSPLKIITDDVADGNAAAPRTVFLANTGNEVLNNISVSITGPNANQFSFNTSGLSSVINAGQSSSFTVTFNPTSVGPKFATLNVSGGNGAQTKSIPLQGLGKVGLGGNNEPSLQWVLDTYFGNGVVNVGDDDPSTPQIHSTQQAAALLGSEVAIQKFQGFTDGPVTIEVLSVFGPTNSNPVVAFGWYESGDANAKHELFSVANSPSSNGQTLNVTTSGLLEFTPTPGQVFGFYNRWPFFSDRHLYSEDALNTFSGAIPHHIRVYPVPGENNAYIIATEEHISGFDYQDIVVIVRNVKPAPTIPVLSFNPNTLNFNVGSNDPVASQTATLNANLPVNVGDISLTSTANWITLPTVALGTPLNFSVNASSLGIGTHNATITANAPGFVAAQLNVTLIKTTTPVWTIKINFQDNSFNPPIGYLADVGSSYGSRGNGYTFGWINPSNNQPKDNTGPARGDERGITNSSSDTDKIMRSLNMFQNTTSGAANWEIALPNGIYQVEVASGDPSFYDSQHTVRAEGVTLISNFIPTAQNTHKTGMGVVTINDGKLTLDPQGGTNTKINYILIAPINQDLVPPVLTANFIGNSAGANIYRNQVSVALSAEPRGNATSVSIQYSTDNINFVSYSLPINYNQVGNYTLYARATDNLNNISNQTFVFQIVPYVPSNAKIWVKNLDEFPADDELTFSRIETPWNGNANHDVVTLQVRNIGSGSLTIDNLLLSDNLSWQILTVGGNPYTAGSDIILPAGATTNVALKFIAKESDGRVSGRVVVLHETLTIVSNSDEEPNKAVKLHGLWQKFGEGDREPFAFEMIDAFGFKTQTGFTSTNNNHNNPIADEVFSPYFVRVDNTKPVTVRQMGAYHGCCTSTEAIWWQPKSNGNSNNVVMRHDGLDGQSLLPRKETSLLPGAGSFTPNEPFSIRIAGDNSDPNRNNYKATNTQGNLFRGVRIWKARDSQGNIIPNAYIMSHDYLSATANLDYNDNMYFLSNLKPELGANAFATLASTPSAYDFGEANLNQTKTITVNITNTGLTGDPIANISSLEIKGANAAEFSYGAPTSSAVSPGESSSIIITYKPLTVGLKNADLLIHYGTSSPLRIPLYGIGKTGATQVTLHHRIKSAANAGVTITNSFTNTSKTWASDTPYRTGSIKLDNTTDVSTVIQATDEDPLYRSYLSSNADLAGNGYNIPLPNAGTYTVRLHFAENFFTATSGRVNNISIEGNLVYGGLDIFKEVGYKSALVKDFVVNVNDGTLNINFAPFVNRPAISGVEVYSFITACNTSLAFTSPTITNADCGQSNGSISIGSANGAGNITYKINNGSFQSNGVFTNLAAGNYTITAKESGGEACEITTQVTVGSNANPINFVINTTPVNCGVTSDGTATISNVSGTSNYTVIWNTIPVQNGLTANGLAVGNYSVTVTDVNGCAKTQNFSIVKAQGCQEIVRINAGGPAQTVGNVNWEGCSATTSCNDYVTGGFAFSKANTITGFTAPMNQTILQTEWTGGQSNGIPVGAVAFTYNIPAGNGSYLVRLHFVELNKTAVGLRVFDVNIEGGEKELVNFDIFQQAGGLNKAIVREFPVNITDGNVTIQFIRQIENAKISAIEIIPQATDTTPPTAPTLSLVNKTFNSVSLSWSGATDNVGVTSYEVYNGANLAGTTSSTSLTVNGLTPNTTYIFTVKAKDAAGNASVASNAINVTTDNNTDTTPPTAPTLSLGSKTHNSVNLTWSGATDNVGVTAYDVFNGASLAGTTASTSLTINGLTPNTAYTFTVKAKDAAGNSSVASNAVNVTTDPAPVTTTTRIEAETNFSILTDVGTVTIASTNGGNGTALSNGLAVRLSDNGDKLRITFNVPSTGIYQLKARVRAGNGSNPTLFWPNGYRFDLDNVQTTFTGNPSTLSAFVSNLFGGGVMGTMETTDLNLIAGTHTLDVTVLRSSGAIDYIELVGQGSGTVDTTPPTAPTLSLGSKTHNSVSLTWSGATDNVGVTAYDVFNGASLAGTTASTSLTINGLTPNTAYTFTVKAKDAAGNSSVASNAVNVTTDPAPVTTTTRIEAETNFSILTDVGTVTIASTNGGNGTALSNGLAVRLSDNGDKLRITFNVPSTGIYQLKARVRAGNGSNPTLFWPNGYRFDLDNVQTTFTGNPSTLSAFVSNLFGGGVMGTMETTDLNLTASTHTLDVTVLRSSGAIDYIELVSIQSAGTVAFRNSNPSLGNEGSAEANEEYLDIKTVYPNPVANAPIIKIQFSRPLNNEINYYLVDVRGVILRTGKLGSLGSSEADLDVSNLKSGAYVIKLESTELKVKAIRFIK